MNWGCLIAAAVAFGCGWGTNGWRLDAAYQAKDNARLQAVAIQRDAAMADLEKLTAELSENNDTHTAQLKKVQNENNTLRNRISAGAVSLRVAATCPQQAKEPTSASVDNGTRPELDATVRPDYYALRDGINQVTAQLGACQGELSIRQ
jgi:prophage endopeptidase